MTDIWVCGNCHSINRQRSKNCYKCGSAQSVAATDDGATHRQEQAIAMRSVVAYRPAAALGLAASIFLVGLAAVQVFGIIESFGLARFFTSQLDLLKASGTFDDGAFNARLADSSRLDMIGLAVVLPALLFFAAWLSRVVSNVSALGGGIPGASPWRAFVTTLIPVTKRIKFGTAVLNLPQHHPAVVAGNAAQFDHLSEGRFIMGVGPGGLGSDFELFQTFEKNRAEMMAESIDMIHKIWASDPPYRLHGKYWDIVVDEQMQKHLGIGPMLKPYQKPHPPLAMSVMSPRSGTARFAGERGWGMISANFTPAINVKTHWEVYCDGAASVGRKPDRQQWRVARSGIREPWHVRPCRRAVASRRSELEF